MKKLITIILSFCILCSSSMVAFSEGYGDGSVSTPDEGLDEVYTSENTLTFCDFENVTGGTKGDFCIEDTGDLAYGKAFKIPASAYADAKGTNLNGSYTFDGTGMTLFNEPLEQNTYYIMEYDFKANTTASSVTNRNLFSFAPQLDDFAITTSSGGTDWKDYTQKITGEWTHHRIAFYSGNATSINLKINTEASYYLSYIDNYRITKAVGIESEAPMSGAVATRKGAANEYYTYYNNEVSIKFQRAMGEQLTFSMGEENRPLTGDTLVVTPTANISVTSEFSKSLFAEELPYPTTEDLEKIYVKPGDSVSDLLSASKLDRTRAKYYDAKGKYKAYSQLEMGGKWSIYNKGESQFTANVTYLGDMDGNDELNVTDLVALRNEVLVNGNSVASDLDLNGKCTVSDVVGLRKAILNYDELFEEDDGILKVFSIGNSFSQDSVTRLYEVAKACGYTNVVFAYATISYSDLEGHYANFTNGSNGYTYYEYNKSSSFMSIANADIYTCLKRQNWDYITYQQASVRSGKPETIAPYIAALTEYAKKEVNNKNLEFLWHSTWAYPKLNPTTGAVNNYLSQNYNNDQDYMYNSIIDVAQNVTMASGLYAGILPTGTAVQNMRTTPIGDNMNRDGLHIESNYGRLTNSLTWFKTLCPEADLNGILTNSTCLATLNSGVSYLATKGVTVTAQELGKYCIAAAEAAVENPYAVTQINLTQ